MTTATKTKIQHTTAIDWPNGLGYTPCSEAYADICDRIEAVKPSDVRMDDLNHDDYETFNRLESERCQMQIEGHVGKSVRF